MEWISVKDKLPDSTEDVLVYSGRYELCTIDCWIKDFSRWVENYDEDITHWMPLPNPPKEE